MRLVIAIITLTWFWLQSIPAAAKESIDNLTEQLARYHVVDTVRVNLLNKLGYEYWIVNPVQSERLGKQAFQLATALKYTEGIAFACRVVGVSHWVRGQYPEALQYLLNGLAAYQTIQDGRGVGSMYNNIGLVYLDQRSYPVALKYFKLALSQAYAVQSKDLQVSTLSNLGNTYLQMKAYAMAEKFYHQYLSLSKSMNRKYGIAESYSNLGQLKLELNKTEQALAFFKQSAEIRSGLQDLEGLTMCHYYIGKTYLAKKKYALAEQSLQAGIETGLQVNSLKWITCIYETLKNLETGRGNYRLAIDYFEAFSAKRDRLFDKEQSRQIAEMQTRFETLQQGQKLQTQRKELALLKEQNRFQVFIKNTLLTGLIAIALITYLIISRQRLKIRKNKELLTKNQEIFETEQALATAQLENARLQEMKLIAELESKNKKLTSYSLNVIQKNELMEELKTNLKQLKKSQGRETARELHGLNRLVDHTIEIDKDWEDFHRNFEEVHTDFYPLLKAHYPDLTSHELKLCTLLKLNMNLKEAAGIMGISPESVKKARHRLRKKFNLSREENLIDHIITLEKQISAVKIQVA